MASEVEICNNALIKLGASRIVALTEDSKNARLCNQIYDQTRDAVLRDHFWNFAMKRVELAELTSTPSFQFDVEYQLPADCLRVLRMEDTDMTFKVEGRKLLTNESTAKILYISRVSDPNEFDALFIEAFSARLAWELCYAITENNTLLQLTQAAYRDKISEARTADAQEGTPDNLEATLWTESRL
jgi:hypothetical protein